MPRPRRWSQALRKAQRHPGGRALIRRRLKQAALVGVPAMVAMSAYLTWPSVVLDSNNVTAFPGWSAPVMDQSLYMVLPFRHRAASAPRLLNGDQCESLLHDALGRWRGVQLVDPLWVADARSRRGGGGSIEDGLSIARERRAGRVVLGEVWEFKDTIYVRGLLYDAAGQKLVREQSIRIAPDLSDAQVTV